MLLHRGRAGAASQPTATIRSPVSPLNMLDPGLVRLARELPSHANKPLPDLSAQFYSSNAGPAVLKRFDEARPLWFLVPGGRCRLPRSKVDGERANQQIRNSSIRGSVLSVACGNSFIACARGVCWPSPP